MRQTIYILTAIFLLLLTGCNSFLDVIPDDRTEIKDVESVKALLVSAYADGHSMMFGELMSDNADDKGSWLVAIMPEMQEESYFWQESTQEGQDSPVNYWNANFKAISVANHALEAIEDLGDLDELQPYKGEAKLARAYGHFMLVNFWGEHYNPAKSGSDLGIPYVTQPEKEAQPIYHRNTVKEVYDLIEKDLVEGLPLIQDDAYEVAKYHFNKNAANAFASRYYLFRGDSWDKVIAHCDAVLGEGSNFKLQLRDYAGKYIPIASNPEEFAKLYTNYGESCNLLVSNHNSVWYYSSRGGRYGLSDTRFKEIFTEAQIPKKDWIAPQYGAWPHISLYKFYSFLRYLYPGSSSAYPYVMSNLFTTEEVMFNRAEAYIMKGRYDDLINDLNLYLSVRLSNYDPAHDVITIEDILTFYRAKNELVLPEPWYKNEMTEDQLILLRYITDLRRMEFCSEGMRWFDVKRFYLEVTHQVFEKPQKDVLKKDDPRRLLQIPSTAVSLGMIPNPR